MNTLLVQDYLRSGKTLQDLKIDHGVNSNITNGKISLNYDQIEAKADDLLACECRGLTLEENTFNIVSFPFTRFFNLDDKTHTPPNFDWDSAEFQSKLDGTMIHVFWHDNKWHVGTRSRCEADVPLNDCNWTFSQLFDNTLRAMYVRNQIMVLNTLPQTINRDFFMNCLGGNKNYTYCFELTTIYNRVVCKYNESNITLLLVRNNTTFKEEVPQKIIDNMVTNPFNIKTVEKFSFSNIEDMIAIVRDFNPEDREGLVVVDKNFNRIKVKSPQYVAFNKLNDSLSTSIKGCIEVILLGKDDDIIGMMPEYISNRISKLKPVIKFVLQKAQEEFEKIKHIDNMKEFAGQAEFTIWPAAMYALKRNKTPDLHTFALGNRTDITKIPNSAVETMLSLCERVDPSIRELKLALPGY